MANESLPALVTHASELINNILENDGEISEFMEGELQVSEQALAVKVDSYKIIMEQLVLQQGYWKKKAADCAKIAKSLGGAEKALKDNIKVAMLSLDTDEMKGNSYRFKLSSSKPKLELNEEVLADKYYTRVETFVPDKENILLGLNNGVEIPGARILEGHTLRSYVNKGK